MVGLGQPIHLCIKLYKCRHEYLPIPYITALIGTFCCLTPIVGMVVLEEADIAEY